MADPAEETSLPEDECAPIIDEMSVVDVVPTTSETVSRTATPPITPPSGENEIDVEPTVATSSSCDMCANYETQLQQVQETEHAARQKLTAAQHLVDRYHGELSGERLFRTELEGQINTQYKQCSAQVAAVKEKTAELQKSLDDVEEQELVAQLREQLDLAAKNRASLAKKCDNMYQVYSDLLKTRMGTAATLRDATIDLPQSIDQLHVLCLTLRENLIDVTAAKENLEQSMGEQIMLLRQQMEGERLEHVEVEKAIVADNQALMAQVARLQKHEQTRLQASTSEASLPAARQQATQQRAFADMERKLATALNEKAVAVALADERRTKLTQLQTELDTSESVQRDFVKLSQSLQMKLELIRQNEKEVRWQYEEDVLSCNGCDAVFAHGSSVKLHCRHCGRIFCDACLERTVTSGPSERKARVCELCHTLLVSEARPYFSKSDDVKPNSKMS